MEEQIYNASLQSDYALGVPKNYKELVSLNDPTWHEVILCPGLYQCPIKHESLWNSVFTYEIGSEHHQHCYCQPFAADDMLGSHTCVKILVI